VNRNQKIDSDEDTIYIEGKTKYNFKCTRKILYIVLWLFIVIIGEAQFAIKDKISEIKQKFREVRYKQNKPN
jgi:hypothetical protein